MESARSPGTLRFWEDDMPDRISDMFEVIAKRRTVRKFTDVPVPEEDLLKILDAARMAPSAGNQQPWKFLVIQDPERIARVKQVGMDEMTKRIREHPTTTPKTLDGFRAKTAAYLEGIFAAPVFIAMLGDKDAKYPDYLKHDVPLAAENLMLAARALGYGTVYGTDFVPATALRVALEIPDRYEITCTIALGVPEAWPGPPEKADLESFIVRERFD
jgi:nitroreductase